MKSRIKERIGGLFSDRAERVFYTAVAIYVVAFFIIQGARFIIQNLYVMLNERNEKEKYNQVRLERLNF